jgi:hypothetical protein
VQRFYPAQYESGRVLALLAIDVLAIALFFLSFGTLDLVYRIIIGLVLSAVIIYIAGLYKARVLIPAFRPAGDKSQTVKEQSTLHSIDSEL